MGKTLFNNKKEKNKVKLKNHKLKKKKINNFFILSIKYEQFFFRNLIKHIKK